jgi:hypothetical protein
MMNGDDSFLTPDMEKCLSLSFLYIGRGPIFIMLYVLRPEFSETESGQNVGIFPFKLRLLLGTIPFARLMQTSKIGRSLECRLASGLSERVGCVA